MSHFRSNLRDIEFNLFDVHRIDEYMTELGDIDRDTALDILREVDRLAREEWAASFVEADRAELRLEDGEVKLPESMKESLAALREGGWDRMGIDEELGGLPMSPT